MRLNWGPYLWMRCYNNGAQFLDRVVGERPDWEKIGARGPRLSGRRGRGGYLAVRLAGAGARRPFPRVWNGARRSLRKRGGSFRASLEALAYLIARAVKEHEAAGQKITRITVSGGIARSDLMCEILASVLDRPLEQLVVV